MGTSEWHAANTDDLRMPHFFIAHTLLSGFSLQVSLNGMSSAAAKTIRKKLTIICLASGQLGSIFQESPKAYGDTSVIPPDGVWKSSISLLL